MDFEIHGDFKKQLQFLTALEKFGNDEVQKGNQEYEIVRENARYRKEKLIYEERQKKLAVLQLSYFHTVDKLEKMKAIRAQNLKLKSLEEITSASAKLVPLAENLHSLANQRDFREMVPLEEARRAELNVLAKQRLSALQGIYEIRSRQFENSEIGQKLKELKDRQEKLEQQIKSLDEETKRHKIESKIILDNKRKQIQELIVKVLLLKKENENKKPELLEKLNRLDLMSGTKPQSFRDMFPENLHEEIRKLSTNRNQSKKDIALSKNFTSITKDKFETKNENIEITSKLEKDMKIINKTEDESKLFIKMSKEMEFTKTQKSSTQKSDLTLLPTNFEKYDYLNSFSSIIPQNINSNLRKSQSSQSSNNSKIQILSDEVLVPSQSQTSNFSTLKSQNSEFKSPTCLKKSQEKCSKFNQNKSKISENGESIKVSFNISENLNKSQNKKSQNSQEVKKNSQNGQGKKFDLDDFLEKSFNFPDNSNRKDEKLSQPKETSKRFEMGEFSGDIFKISKSPKDNQISSSQEEDTLKFDNDGDSSSSGFLKSFKFDMTDEGVESESFNFNVTLDGDTSFKMDFDDAEGNDNFCFDESSNNGLDFNI